MFKTITFTTILVFSISANDFISFDAAISSANVLAGGLDSSMDLLESSSDLLGEISEDSSELGQFTKDMSQFNKSMKSLESDMRYLGYSEDQISLNMQKLSSNKNSLEQKMRALTKSVKNVKKIKDLISKLSTMAAVKGGGVPDPSSQAILANQQQLLHLQIQQLKNGEMSALDEKISDIEFKKSIAQELDLAKIDLINSKENSSKNIFRNKSDHYINLQDRSIKISICLCVIGSIGLMITFFRSEGIATLKAGLLGIILSYLIPSIVNLYSQWLGL